MKFIQVPTEQTTAVTDLILFILTVTLAWFLMKQKDIDRVKVKIWVIAFFSLSLASFLGFVAHGFVMSRGASLMLWRPLNFFLGLTIAFIGLGIIYDLKKRKLPQWLYWVAVLIAIGFFGITVIRPGSFIFFIMYEAMVMLFGLVVYTILLFRKSAGAGRILAGIIFTILAAVIQATRTVELELIWTFDHNGVFHLVQVIGILFVYSGVKKELDNRNSMQQATYMGRNDES